MRDLLIGVDFPWLLLFIDSFVTRLPVRFFASLLDRFFARFFNEFIFKSGSLLCLDVVLASEFGLFSPL